ASLLLLLSAPVFDGMPTRSGLGHALPCALARIGDVRELRQRAEFLADHLPVDPVERLPRLQPARRDAQAEARQLRIPRLDASARRRLQPLDSGLCEFQIWHLAIPVGSGWVAPKACYGLPVATHLIPFHPAENQGNLRFLCNVVQCWGTGLKQIVD